VRLGSSWLNIRANARTLGKPARFVKRFADIGGELRRAAMQYAEEVASGFPRPTSTASKCRLCALIVLKTNL
jgi:hypothetical protein